MQKIKKIRLSGIEKVSIVCNGTGKDNNFGCRSELTFNLDEYRKRQERGVPVQCPICGSKYNIDGEHDPFMTLKNAQNFSESMEIYIIVECEED